MSSREELYQLLDSLPDDELEHILGFVKVHMKEPEDLTPEEREELRKGEQEIQEGDWVRWRDVKRTDV